MEEDKPWRIFVRRTVCPNVGRAVCCRLIDQAFGINPNGLMTWNNAKPSSVLPKNAGGLEIVVLNSP